MPAQQRLRRHDQPPPSRRGEYPSERREEGTIGWPDRRAWLLPTKNSKLMPQNKQFDVLGEHAATARDQQPQHRREREVSEREEHLPMLPESRLRGLEKRNRGFETPQGAP